MNNHHFLSAEERSGEAKPSSRRQIKRSSHSEKLRDRNRGTNETSSWIAERGGTPSIVEQNEAGSTGLLRIDFEEDGVVMQTGVWDETAQLFRETEIVFLYQIDEGGGRTSRFFRFNRYG